MDSSNFHLSDVSNVFPVSLLSVPSAVSVMMDAPKLRGQCFYPHFIHFVPEITEVKIHISPAVFTVQAAPEGKDDSFLHKATHGRTGAT